MYLNRADVFRKTRSLALATVALVGGLAPLSYAAGAVQAAPPSRWSVTGSLVNPRQSHTATLLPDGSVLVVGGGFGSVESYDAASGTWSETNPLSTAFFYHSATLLPGGDVLIAGGGADSLKTVELFDPNADAAIRGPSLVKRRQSHTATLLRDGRVLVVGGRRYPSNPLTSWTKSAEIYDPVTGRWSKTGSLESPRIGNTATLLLDGRVLVTGGAPLNQGRPLSSAEIFDPATGRWTPTGSLLTRRFGHSATLLADGKVLVVGGNDSRLAGAVASAEVFDPTSGVWSQAGSLTEVRRHHTATLLTDGRVLVVGGLGLEFPDALPLASAELYDPTTDTWQQTDPLTTARFFHTATLLADGKILVVGGRDEDSTHATAEIYDPSPGR
jgi:WD40 repeat protein